MAMPSSSAAGSSRLDAQGSDDTCLEGVVVVDAAAARGGAGPIAPSDVWAELFPAAPIVGDPAEPPELRPLERDLCLAAYGVAQEDVTRELQWRCGGGSGVGIGNLGLTCFVNAVAQVLLRVAPVRRLLVAHDEQCRRGAGSCATCALGAQAAALSVEGAGFDGVAPLAVAARAGLFDNGNNPEFAIQENQCDAAEFFRAAIGALRASERSTCTSAGPHGERTALQQHVCGIAFRQRRRCDTCGATSDRGNISTALQVYPELLLQHGGACNLQDLIRRELRYVGPPETGCPAYADLSDAQRAIIGACAGTRVYKGNRWERSPPVLFVIVNRVNKREDGTNWYDRRRVCFPKTLQPVEGGRVYDFSGVVVHQGESFHGGHYLAYGTVGVNDYAEFNDRAVWPKTWGDFANDGRVQRGAYVFAYVRAASAGAGGDGRSSPRLAEEMRRERAAMTAEDLASRQRRDAAAAPCEEVPGAGDDDGAHADGDDKDEQSEDEMCYSTERSSSSESDESSSSGNSSSENEATGDGDGSSRMNDEQPPGPVAGGSGSSGNAPASSPQKAESEGASTDAPVATGDPVASAAQVEEDPMSEDGGDDVQGGGDGDGVDDFSDVSDDSDLFHVEAKKNVGEPRTDEDKDMAVVDSIASHLRVRSLLPPDGEDVHEVFGDTATEQGRLQMQSGCRMPALHCGFKGCDWTCDLPITRRWEMERRLCVHLREKHKDCEMACVPEEAWPSADKVFRIGGHPCD